MPRFMGDLQKKFERELRSGTKIVANISPLPGWEPVAKRENVYLYKIGPKRP